MTCSRCDHFSGRAMSDATTPPAKTEVNRVGICRRYPPRMTRHVNGHLASVFPNVHRDHACGEFHDSRAIPC